MTSPAPAPAPTPIDIIKSRSYLALLVLGAVIGVPVATVAYFFLQLVAKVQVWVFTSTCRTGLGYPRRATVVAAAVAVPLRAAGGPGHPVPARHRRPRALRGLQDRRHRARRSSFRASPLAALATLCLGVVLGPEAPLIAIGGGLGCLAIHLAKRDAPDMAVAVIGAAGSFAAIATLLGSPLDRRLPAHGDGRLGRRDDGARAAPRPAGCRHRLPHLRRAQRLTGFGLFSLTIAGPSPRRIAHGRPSSSGRSVIGVGRRRSAVLIFRLARPAAAPCRAAAGPAHPGGGAGRRRAWPSLFAAGDRHGLGRGAVLRAVGPARSRAQPPAGRSARCCCSWPASAWPTASR